MSKKGVAKSLGLTLLGIVLFLVKIPGQGQSVFNLIVSMIEKHYGTRERMGSVHFHWGVAVRNDLRNLSACAVHHEE